MKDYGRTWLLTKSRYYVFTWYFSKYKNKIAHLENCLQEIYVKSGFGKFDGFYKRVVSISIYYSFNFDLTSITKQKMIIIGKPMDLTP